ncbi:copper homeostasis protein CutC [Clostridium sp. D2Q-14]|nr:copper homeostasis protein CutC [Anaeromonas gelatinilytica]
MAEICCDSLEDALIAQRGGAHRIELNNSIHLGGLTPSMGTIRLVAKNCRIPIVVMVRPRGAGFYYNDYEFNTMISDIETMMAYDIEGVAFGCLDENGKIDKIKNKKIIDILNNNNKDAIFHRAFDCVKNPYESIEILIELGVKRVLTSGLRTKAIEAVELLAELQYKYGDKIEILVGSGVNESNVKFLIDKTNIMQYHSSCKAWRKDPTTVNNISYAYAEHPHEQDYNIVDYKKVIKFVNRLENGY